MSELTPELGVTDLNRSLAFYRVGDREVAQRQFCVQDPDGYLLRFCEDA